MAENKTLLSNDNINPAKGSEFPQLVVLYTLIHPSFHPKQFCKVVCFPDHLSLRRSHGAVALQRTLPPFQTSIYYFYYEIKHEFIPLQNYK